MEANTSATGRPDPFRPFDEKSQSGFGFGFGSGFLDAPEKPLPPPPPSVEVLPSQVSAKMEFNVEPVDLDGFTLLKGRVSTKEVFGLSNSDLIPGKYEGGLKLWEGSLDLVKTLSSEMQSGQLSLTGKRVLELGCGHGLPGIFACLKGARAVHFQDFNSEVLQCLTIPNVNANIQQNLSATDDNNSAEVRFFASDWSEAHLILPHVPADDGGTKKGQTVDQAAGYDIILMAETVYSVSTLPSLYKLIKKCLHSPHGIVYLAAKKHYFGVGGGSRRFISIVEKDGILAASLVSEVTDGSSNVREVWKLHFREFTYNHLNQRLGRMERKEFFRVSEYLRALTNPVGAQALGKEFFASAPRLIQVLPSPMALRNCLHPVGFELETLKGSRPQGSSQLPLGQPLRVK